MATLAAANNGQTSALALLKASLCSSPLANGTNTPKAAKNPPLPQVTTPVSQLNESAGSPNSTKSGVSTSNSSASLSAMVAASRSSEGESKPCDDSYRERRRKNNEAAKRSRDARRAKEDDIALRAALLERENLQLKVELNQLKQETQRLRCLLFNS